MWYQMRTQCGTAILRGSTLAVAVGGHRRGAATAASNALNEEVRVWWGEGDKEGLGALGPLSINWTPLPYIPCSDAPSPEL